MQHQELAAGRWFTLTLAEQLGNAGSEFYRAKSWQQKGDTEKFSAAAGRFFELLDLTLSDSRWNGARRREIARVREQATAELLRDNTAGPSLQKYFDQFALLARTSKSH